MYNYLIDQAQAKRERFRAEIQQDRLIGQVKTDTQRSTYFITRKGVPKMQFKRQWVAALLLAGSILTASLAWAEAIFSQANRGTDTGKTDAVSYDSNLSPDFHFSSIKGGKGGVSGGDVHK
jgi:hypothetical protein